MVMLPYLTIHSHVAQILVNDSCLIEPEKPGGTVRRISKSSTGSSKGYEILIKPASNSHSKQYRR